MKEKGFTLINIMGLALGLACFLLLMVYVIHEYSYEKFIPNHERIYRIYQDGGILGESDDFKMAYMPYKATEYLKNNYPEIEQVTTVDIEMGFVMTYKEKFFIDWRTVVADSSFFKLFPTDFIYGDPHTSLTGPNKIVLTETSAEKWFGDENPIGKFVDVSFDSIPFEITGVVKDSRADTHLRYSMLISDQSLKYGDNATWWNSRYRINYIKVKEGVNIPLLEDKLQKILEDGLFSDVEKFTGQTLEQALGSKKMPRYRLQAIKDVYIDGILDFELHGQKANKTLIYIAVIIAIAILLLACINFINLSTARFSNRLKEICVKKTVGADRKMLFYQFISEAFIVTFISIFLGLSIAELSMEAFCDMLNLEFVISIFDIPYIFLFILSVFLVVGLLSGAYPAFVMSATKITDGFRNAASKKKGSLLRKLLVAFQFVISFAILLGAFTVKSQLNFINKDDKGYTRENLSICHNVNKDIPKEKWKTFKAEVLKIPGVKNASFGNSYPSEYVPKSTIVVEKDAGIEKLEVAVRYVDNDFIETMQIQLLQGKDFNKDVDFDTLSVIINESAIALLGYDSPIGQYIKLENFRLGDRKLKIIGIIKDYHYQPVTTKIEPVILIVPTRYLNKMLVRFKDGEKVIAQQKVQELWRKFSGGKNVYIEDLGESLEYQYRSEISANKIVTVFSILCILIACLGLIGLVSYTTLRKTKEIGIRKANGAQVWQILLVLSRETLLIITIAIVIALPLAFYLINLWLSMYEYHVEISALDIILSVVFIYLIALISEVVLTIRVARKNPIESLRYE